MQMKTFAYGAPQGGSPRALSCLPSALSLGTCQRRGVAAREGLSPGPARRLPEDWRRGCHGDGTRPTLSQAPGLRLLVSGSLLSPPPRPPSLDLQPRSCTAPWRPSSALSQVWKWKGLSAAKWPKARGPYPAASSGSEPRRRGAVTPALFRADYRGLPWPTPCLPTPAGLSPGGFQVTRRWQNVTVGEDFPPLRRPSPSSSAPS